MKSYQGIQRGDHQTCELARSTAVEGSKEGPLRGFFSPTQHTPLHLQVRAKVWQRVPQPLSLAKLTLSSPSAASI